MIQGYSNLDLKLGFFSGIFPTYTLIFFYLKSITREKALWFSFV